MVDAWAFYLGMAAVWVAVGAQLFNARQGRRLRRDVRRVVVTQAELLTILMSDPAIAAAKREFAHRRAEAAGATVPQPDGDGEDS